MRFIIFILISLSFSGFANEFNPNYECISSKNPDDIIKFEEEVFDITYNDSYGDKTIDIQINDNMKVLEFWKIFEPDSVISEYWFQDREKGFGYDYFFSNYKGVVEIKYYIPDTYGSILYRCHEIN